MQRLINRDTVVLAKGSHGGANPDDPNCEVCFWEAYNLLILPPDGDPQITDRCPPGVSPVLHKLAMRLNDLLPADQRQTLKAYLPNGVSPLAGTATDGLDEQRRLMAIDWTVRTATPTWLDAAGYTAQAGRLRGLAPVTTWGAYDVARPVVRAIRDEMYEARREAYARLRAKYGSAAVADADAVADAVAVAVAVAVADADAVAVAVAAAAADADAVAVAVAAADADSYSVTYGRVYTAAQKVIEERFAPITAQLQQGALDLYARMIAPPKS